MELSEDEIRDFFYQMNASIRRDHAAFLPTHFSSLFAFWANMFFASLFLLGTVLISWIVRGQRCFNLDINPGVVILVILVVGGSSIYFADKFLKSFYDTILNCYEMGK